MANQDLNLLEAIGIAKAAEEKAEAFYAQAAQETTVVACGLFETLATFEHYHYEKLQALEDSLRQNGAFVEYEGRELVLEAPGEVTSVTVEEAQKMSLMGIVTTALDVETQAEKRYLALSEQTEDPAGKAMFTQLAKEEKLHHRVLQHAYWSLNDRGVWEMPKL